jgi:hypothetical protein
VKTIPGGGIDWSATKTYNVPAGFTQYEDLYGNVYPLVNSEVTIGASPILLQNKRIVGRDGLAFFDLQSKPPAGGGVRVSGP